MIQPVRPVGYSALSAPLAVQAQAYCARLIWGDRRCGALWLRSWIGMPLGLALHQEGLTALSRGLADTLQAVRAGQAIGEHAPEPDEAAGQPAAGDSDADERVEWTPWPAHPPFADEVTRWWPSDDWPPSEPPVVVEDRIPDAPAEVIDWRATGSLLDFWI